MKAADWLAFGAESTVGMETYCGMAELEVEPLLLRNCWYVIAVVKWLLLGVKHWEPDAGSWLLLATSDATFRNASMSLWVSFLPVPSPAEILTNAAIT
jgi:hypothetical protein